MIYKNLHNLLSKHAALRLIPAYSILILLLMAFDANAQQSRNLTLQEAISLGLENSKQLRLSHAKIEEAVSRFNQTRDKALPSSNATFIYNHAEIPTTDFKISADSDPLHLPSRSNAMIGTFSLQEVIFAGNKLRYAKESTDLLIKVARLDADHDREEIAFNIANNYINLFRLEQSRKIIKLNLEDIDSQIKQANQFFKQGIITKNEVLRFQLQRSNIELTGVDVETNSKIVNYNLVLLLGLPENTLIAVDEQLSPGIPKTASEIVDAALTNRTEIKSLELQGQAANNNIKSIKADLSPTVLLGTNVYYINPSGSFIPEADRFIAPVTVGATVAWNIDRLWTTKNKVAEAQIQRSKVDFSRDLVSDQIKSQVNQDYQNYTKSLARIRILESTIEQARENNRILESKYNNNVASATDRIDAETQLYQSLTNLELARAEATLAYYTLLKSSGTITKSSN
jgi:outer membrane protein